MPVHIEMSHVDHPVSQIQDLVGGEWSTGFAFFVHCKLLVVFWVFCCFQKVF